MSDSEKPTPQHPIPIFAVRVSEHAIERVASVLRSGFIGDGPTVREFESKVMARTGARHAVAVNSGTSALQLALAVHNVGPGDEVITTAQTFVATSHVILAAGAQPVYADVQSRTGNLDPADIEHRITPRTKAILPVHWAGYPCDMDEILDVATRHGLAVIEDAAHAFGAEYRGRAIGSVAPVTCFSFQAIKQLTTVDGGMLCTQDEALGEQARRRRWFGIDRIRRRPSVLGEPEWDIKELGYKWHMNDVAAAIGCAHLDEYDLQLAHRALLDSAYRTGLAGVPGVELFDVAADRRSAFWTFCLHVERRLDFVRAMKARGIEASVVHLRIDRNSLFGPVRTDLPQLARFTETMVCLPLHGGVSEQDAAHVVEAVRKGW